MLQDQEVIVLENEATIGAGIARKLNFSIVSDFAITENTTADAYDIKIADGAVSNNHINAAANIAYSKLDAATIPKTFSNFVNVKNEYVLVLLLRDHRAAQQPREDRDVHDTDRDHHLPETRAEHRDDRDREEQTRDGEHDVHQPHDDRARPATDIAGERAEQQAHGEPDPDGHDADQQRIARAVHDPAEDVAPLEVEAQQVLAARWLRLQDPADEVDVVRRVARRDPLSPDGADHEHAHQHGADDRPDVVREPVPRLAPEPTRRLLELELRDFELGDAHPEYLIRGLITAYATSTTRLTSTKTSARKRIPPWSTG